MALFEEITDRVAQLAKVGSKKVKNTGKIASLKVSNLSAQEEINKLYAKIGERYYREHGLAPEAGYEKLTAKVPQKEMANYSTALSSLTGGRASFIQKFASYELVPSDVQQNLIKAYEASKAAEE